MCACYTLFSNYIALSLLEHTQTRNSNYMHYDSPCTHFIVVVYTKEVSYTEYNIDTHIHYILYRNMQVYIILFYIVIYC